MKWNRMGQAMIIGLLLSIIAVIVLSVLHPVIQSTIQILVNDTQVGSSTKLVVDLIELALWLSVLIGIFAFASPSGQQQGG